MTDVRVAAENARVLVAPSPAARVAAENSQVLLTGMPVHLRMAASLTKVLIGPETGTPWRVWDGGSALAVASFGEWGGVAATDLSQATVGIWDGAVVVPVEDGFV